MTHGTLLQNTEKSPTFHPLTEWRLFILVRGHCFSSVSHDQGVPSVIMKRIAILFALKPIMYASVVSNYWSTLLASPNIKHTFDLGIGCSPWINGPGDDNSRPP